MPLSGATLSSLKQLRRFGSIYTSNEMQELVRGQKKMFTKGDTPRETQDESDH